VRQVAAIVAGNGLEFYDFLTYAFFALQIGQTFFPSDKPSISLLASLATFGAGFLARPIGAYVIGRYADRAGRKPAMQLSFGLMGLAIIGLALTPAYRSIGVAAPVLVILFRLIQGFAVGGEVGPSTAFLVEAAPPERRGFYVSLQYLGQDGAILAAGLIGVIMSMLTSAEGLTAWGWRVAFLIGALIFPFGFALRSGLSETLSDVDEARPSAMAVAGRQRNTLRIALLGLMLIASGTTVGFLLNYMTTYATATLHMPARFAFGATVVAGLAGLMFDPIGGWLSDRFGRKPVMILPRILLLVLVPPCFYLMAHFRTPAALLGATAIMAAANSTATSSALVAITESLPQRTRSGTLGLIYAAAVSVFGGSAQFVVAWLTDISHNALAPAWYMAGGVLVGLAAMSCLKETAPSRRGDREADSDLTAGKIATASLKADRS
jgi:MHS family citrate/tricarballylate:H+ symporter-like MFS transporter